MNKVSPSHLILKIRDLPTLPNTISAILSLVNDPGSTAIGFTDIIKKD